MKGLAYLKMSLITSTTTWRISSFSSATGLAIASLQHHSTLGFVFVLFFSSCDNTCDTQLYWISKSQVSREVWHIIPKLYLSLDEIHLSTKWTPHSFEGVSAVIDCSSYFHYQVHPWQAEWYHYDKHGFFFTAQVIVDMRGIILSVKLGMGHNNDKGMLNLTEMKAFKEEYGVKWLADSGYFFERLITPDTDKSTAWNNTQKRLHSVVETTIGMVKLFRLAAECVTICVELHELCLLICYQLTNIILKKYPLRLC
jgi:DDE superfamily endonuclease